jgi:hypothetical protein
LYRDERLNRERENGEFEEDDFDELRDAEHALRR